MFESIICKYVVPRGYSNIHTNYLVLISHSFICLGSTYLFDGIMKGSEYLDQITKSGNSLFNVNSPLVSEILWLLFHGLWLIPIYVLCYISSTTWYQEIGDEIVRQKKGTELTKAVATGMYALIAWIMIFMQYMILNLGIPMVCDQLITISGYIDGFMGRSLQLSLTLIKYIASSLAIVLQCVLYGWYGFDPHWIAERKAPVERFGIIQKHWAYFVGFGMPYVIIMRTTSFFVGYGIYLGLFPFCIMLACTAIQENKYQAAYPKKYNIAEIEIFYYAKLWSQMVLSNLPTPAKKGE